MSTHTLVPLAYHLIWNTYGTWLPGDSRGYAHRRSACAQPAAPALRAWCLHHMEHPPLSLRRPQRAVVAQVLRDVCLGYGWQIHAQAVRSEHVHVVVAAEVTAARATQSIKSLATRRIRALVPAWAERPLWADGACMRHLFSQEEIRRAVRYVLDPHHDDAG